MKYRLFKACLLVVAILSGIASLNAQPVTSSNSMWQDVSESQAVARLSSAQRSAAKREIIPKAFRTLSLDRAVMQALLKKAPLEAGRSIEQGIEIQLPLPEGGFGRFHLVESPIMESALAAKFPNIKTYLIQGIDDPIATGRIDVTLRGFRATVLSGKGRFFIDPYWNNDDSIRIAYYTRDYSNPDKLKQLNCEVGGSVMSLNSPQAERNSAHRPTGASLRTYRLALATTFEYSTAVSTAPITKEKVLAAMVTSVNRVTAVYEREFAIRLTLVANTDTLIFITSSDPYTNNNGSTMLNQNQTQVTSSIGAANYDIGHVFSTGGGGVAILGCVCKSASKAKGVTGSPSPVGDAYDIDYVAHEMGHQFGGNHTFNGTAAAVGAGTRNAATAYEPGSGSTIMAYAGICPPQDLQKNSDDYFHSANYTEIDNNTSVSPGNGATSTNFPAAIATGNFPPVITLPATANNVPSQTPFALTARATDANGDSLTYCWEEFDKGAVQDPLLRVDNGASPIFRSYNPTTSPTRYFPSLKYILNNANIPPVTYTVSGKDYVTGEFLPTTSRTMNFRVSVRDNRAGGGGQDYATAQVSSFSGAGPFKINTPNTAVNWTVGIPQSVTWDVANTTTNTVDLPINCQNVKISFSKDGGNTFPIVLAASTPNTGTASVTIASATDVTTTGRIKVEAVGNIFFDISDANFIVTEPPTFANTFPGYNPNDEVGGVPALIAYALNGSTTGNNRPILPQASSSGGVLQITFLARTNDPHIAITVEGNTDMLGQWTPTATQVAGVDQTGVPAGFERQTWSFTSTGKGFLRVRATQVP